MVQICNKEIKQNITKDCNTPLQRGFEQIALIMTLKDFSNYTKTKDSTNPRIFTNIVGQSSTIATVYNVQENPFEGTATNLNTENVYSGRFDKSVSFNVPMLGAGVAKDIIDPLFSGAPFVVILQKKYKGGDGSFEIIGSENGAIISEGSRDMVADGYWRVTLTEKEAGFGEVVLFAGTYSNSLSNFNSLLTLSY